MKPIAEAGGLQSLARRKSPSANGNSQRFFIRRTNFGNGLMTIGDSISSLLRLPAPPRGVASSIKFAGSTFVSAWSRMRADQLRSHMATKQEDDAHIRLADLFAGDAT